MTSRDFCFWLQGMFELGTPRSFDEVRTDLIRKHLQLVFKHEIDPSMGPAPHQAKLNEVHNPPFKMPPQPDEKWQQGTTGTPHEGLISRC